MDLRPSPLAFDLRSCCRGFPAGARPPSRDTPSDPFPTALRRSRRSWRPCKKTASNPRVPSPVSTTGAASGADAACCCASARAGRAVAATAARCSSSRCRAGPI